MLDLQTMVSDGIQHLGLSISEERIALGVRYIELLNKWRNQINLVGTKNVPEIVEQHVIDSLAVVGYLPASASRIVDVGSGAGLPGVLIAVARPDIMVTALEPNHKKHAFLTTTRRELNLVNFLPYAQRLEAHLQASDFQPYDVAVSRATFAISEWIQKADSLVGIGGTIIAMEGRIPESLPKNSIRYSYTLGSKNSRTRALILVTKT